MYFFVSKNKQKKSHENIFKIKKFLYYGQQINITDGCEIMNVNVNEKNMKNKINK